MRLILYADLRLDALLSSALTKHGFRVQTAHTLDTIPSACERGVWPSALLVCLKPADTDGVAFVQSFRAAFGSATPPMVFIIARDSPDLAQALRSAGVSEVFEGPVPLSQLTRRVKEIAGGHQPADEAPTPFSIVRAPVPVWTSANLSPVTIGPPSLSGAYDKTLPLSIPPPNLQPAAKDEESEPAEESPPESDAFDIDFSEEVAEEADPAPAADPPADARVRWPARAASLAECQAALVQRAKAAPVSGMDEALVSETWKALTLAEVQSLKAVDSGQASPEAESLARFSAERLRLRLIVSAAEQLLATNTERVVDDAAITALQQELDRDLKERLDPALQAAVTAADLQQMKDLRTLREALLLRRSDLARLAARLRGEAEQKRVTALLDREEPAPEKPLRSSNKIQAKLLSITTVAAQRAARHPFLSGGALAAVAGIALFFHLVVFDTFRSSNAPDVVDDTSGIAGVERIERFGNTARVVVSDAFDISKGLPELVTHIGGDATIIVENAQGIQVANLMPGQKVESKLPPAPPKPAEETAATPPG